MYRVVYGFLYLISLLPWWLMYLVSDAAYIILYYVTGYRKKVVMSNLDIAFPHKTEAEKIRIAKDFYHNFIDTFIEIIKLLSISKKSVLKRFTANMEVLNDLYESDQNVTIMAGHFFNWEMINMGISLLSRYPIVVIYTPVDNKMFNRLILRLREKFGSILISKLEYRIKFKDIAKGRYALGLLADQNPGDIGKAYWVPFFGKLVPVFKGPEKTARSSKNAVLFCNFYKVKRGHYHQHFQLVTTDPRSYKEGQLTKELIKLTEDAIQQRPSNYLWSHRRWKYEYNETFKDLVH